MGKQVRTGSWWRHFYQVEIAQCDLCCDGESSGYRGSPEEVSDPALGEEEVGKDGLKEVASKLKLKDKENLTRRTEGKDVPGRMNRKYEDSESGGSGK